MYDMSMFGRVIAEQRKKLGLTQEELANRLMLTPQAVSKWENGLGYPDLSLIPRIAEELKIPIERLFGAPDTATVTKTASTGGSRTVLSYGDMICVSNKAVRECTNDCVYFVDGSSANLVTGEVVNMGDGEIRIVRSAAEYKNSRNASAELEFTGTEAPFKNLSLDICGSCDVNVYARAREGAKVTATGTQNFLNNIDCSVNGDTLFIKVEPRAYSSNMGRYSNNRIDVYAGEEACDKLKTVIRGSGDVNVEPSFAQSDINISGSGDVSLADVGKLLVQVSGSGDIGLKKADELDITINGSGDLCCDEVGAARVRTYGSGDTDIANVTKSLEVKVMGSGDVSCGGSVEQLKLEMSGSGDFDGAKLTACEAELYAAGVSSITVGRIIKSSTERISRVSSLKVLKRG